MCSLKNLLYSLAGVLILSNSPVAMAGRTMDTAAKEIAETVNRYLQEKEDKTIFLADFDIRNSSAGKDLRLKVKEALISIGVKIAETEIEGNWTLKGRLVALSTGTASAIRVKLELEDASGERIREFNDLVASDVAIQAKNTEVQKETEVPASKDPSDIEVGGKEGAKDVGKTAGLNASPLSVLKQLGVDPAKPADPSITKDQFDAVKESGNKAIADAAIAPSAATEGVSNSIVKVKKESLFAMQLFASSSENGPFRPVPVTIKAGFPFADIKDGEFYEVDIKNNSTFDVGVELLVDGVNSMHFSESEAQRRVGKWVIERGQSGRIKGWWINPNRQDRFFVTADPDSVVARPGMREHVVRKLGGVEPLGMITAVFVMAGNPADLAQPIFLSANGGVNQSATGQGPAVTSTTTMLQRVFQQQGFAEMITIRYQNPEPGDAPPAIDPASASGLKP